MPPVLKTIIGRRAGDILLHLRSSAHAIRPSDTILYTVSVTQHTNSSELSQIVSTLQTLSPNTVGCLSAPLPSAKYPDWHERTYISIASFHPESASVFRSTLPGRAPTQVGRWHAAHRSGQREDEGALLVWENASAPPVDIRASAPDSLVYLTDGAPEGLHGAFSNFPSSSKLGLTATSTPFVTGRPYTLFHNRSIYSSGAVGICFSNHAKRKIPGSSSQWKEGNPGRISTDFPGLQTLLGPMALTSSEGNMVHSIGDSNPSRLILSAIQRGIPLPGQGDITAFKDLRLYLGVLDADSKVQQLFPITSGDPSRGSISLDAEAAPPVGSTVIVSVLPPSVAPDIIGAVQARRHSAGSPMGPEMTFSSISLDDIPQGKHSSGDKGSDITLVLDDVFVAASESGVHVGHAAKESGRRAEQLWKCNVPGGMASMRWS